MGNIHSVSRKLHQLGITATVTSDYKELKKADKIILPGVGHFGKAMENLNQLGLIDTLHEQVLIHQKPILGICLGMQIMAKKSEEGDAQGLGWFDAEVVKFNVDDTLKFKVPHTGWNQVQHQKDSLLTKDIPNLSEFYFVHAYHFQCFDKADELHRTDYSYSFVSAIEKNNIFGVQYHPEKSHDAGLQLLKNFAHL